MIIVGITAFNGLEFLEKCVANYESICDKIIICYQDVSHVGERRKVGDVIIPLFKNHPKVIIDKFVPDKHWNFKRNEMKKHTQMAAVARAEGGTHFILSAVDHFYESHLIHNVLEKALTYDVSFTKTHQYYKHPTWQITPIVEWYMPFTIKLYPHTKFTKVAKYPVLVDPAVKINTTGTWHIFNEDELIVHNYSHIRTDIMEKYKNRYMPMKWSEKQIEKFIKEYENYDIESNPGIERYKGSKIKIVPNYFNL